MHGYRNSNNGINRRSPTVPLNGSSSYLPDQHLSLPVPQMHMSEHEIRHEQLLKQGKLLFSKLNVIYEYYAQDMLQDDP